MSVRISNTVAANLRAAREALERIEVTADDGKSAAVVHRKKKPAKRGKKA